MRKEQTDIGIRVTGLTEKYTPIKSFEELACYKDFRQPLERCGWREPTRIQSHAIPIVLLNKGLVGVSATGSGKTLAYVLPLSYMMKKIPNTKTLVLAPTRQLCKQISTEFAKLMPRDVGCVYGGIHKSLQMQDLFRQVLVATPGRLTDFLRNHRLKFDFVVIDEADRMLEGNFIDQLDEIIKNIGNDFEQMLMFTATITRQVKEVIKNYIKEPVILTIGGSNSFNSNITQSVIRCTNLREKMDEMLNILEEWRGYKVLIFSNTKSKTQELCNEIKSQLRQRASYIHGEVPQDRREIYISMFREGKVNVLVATDVASRGLDINNISLVLNFDFPRDIQTYTHRIGRTARYNKKGRAISFLFRESPDLLYDLVEFMIKCKQTITEDLLRASNYPRARIRELEESLKEQELPPDMPPSPPLPERVKEEEYVEGDTILEQRRREDDAPEPSYRPPANPFSKVKPAQSARVQDLDESFRKTSNGNAREEEDMGFKKNKQPKQDLNQSMNMSFDHFNIPADLQTSFMDLSFRKCEEQSFVESSRVHTDKDSILSGSKKAERFDLNKFKPKCVSMKLTFDEQTLILLYGKLEENEDQCLVVDRNSPAYQKIKSMTDACNVESKKAETLKVLAEVDSIIRTKGICTQAVRIVESNYPAVVFVNQARIKKEFLWLPIFEQIKAKESESATIALPLHNNSVDVALESTEEIEFILKQCVAELRKQKDLKKVRLLIDNQARCKRFLEVAMKMKSF